jgi:hypothetical protein
LLYKRWRKFQQDMPTRELIEVLQDLQSMG